MHCALFILFVRDVIIMIHKFVLHTVDKYISPEELALRAEADKVAEAERRRAEADDSRQRALREMMHGTLEVKKEPTALESMVRTWAWGESSRNKRRGVRGDIPCALYEVS